MDRIILRDVVDGSYSTLDGTTLYKILKPYFEKNESVELSMMGFTPMSTSFFNVSFGDLKREYGIEKYNYILKFILITKFQVDMIKKYFIMKTKEKKRPIILTDEISKVTGEFKCVDCDNEELNGWSSHCRTCGMPIVY